MSELLVHNSLFWDYNGAPLSSWYLCGDGSTRDQRDAHLRWCEKNKCPTVILNMNNEEIMSLWKPGKYMRELDNAKAQVFVEYVQQIHSYGGQPVIAFFDGPQIANAKYPCLNYLDRHGEMIRITVEVLDEYVAAYLVGCETTRYEKPWNMGIVETVIGYLRTLTKKPVGTHSVLAGRNDNGWYMKYGIPRNAQFHCLETSNDPWAGDGRSVADMVSEVRYVVSQANGVAIWVGEHNVHSGARSRAQSRAMAAIEGVYGVGGPM